jgi:bifunctional non-homologous end joining protein LigD
VTIDETWMPPMLASLTKVEPSGDEWVYERKLDGLRCICVRKGSEVHLYSRNRLLFDARFPLVIDALRDLPVDDFVFDGELVVFDDRGATSFGLLQRSGSDEAVELHLFDVLQLLGKDARAHTLLQRKALLRKVIPESGPLRLVEHVSGDAGELLAQACASGWEGLIAKRPHGVYRSGRSSEWLKLKCTASQELVIGGWTEPRGARAGFGALLMGHFDDAGEFRYAGKVGTGFNGELLVSLYASLRALEIEASPFVDNPREPRVHWAKPALVANIGFTEWTKDGRLRHPRFQGLRADKDAANVTRES